MGATGTKEYKLYTPTGIQKHQSKPGEAAHQASMQKRPKGQGPQGHQGLGTGLYRRKQESYRHH
eukprot:6958029-Karenia_brevis.AAC.1